MLPPIQPSGFTENQRPAAMSWSRTSVALSDCWRSGPTAERPYNADEIEFLCQVAGQIATAIEKAPAYQEISEQRNKLAEEKLYLEEEFRSEMGFEQIIGSSPALKHVLQLVETVAPSDSTVLLLGRNRNGKGIDRPRHP